MRRLATAILAGLTCACLATHTPPRLPDADAKLPAVIRVQFVERGKTVVRSVPLETYVESAALSEFAPPAGDLPTVIRMFEVQSIISRTYAVAHMGRHAATGFDLCGTTHCQLFDPARIRTSRWAAAVAAGVKHTEGQILRFDNRPAEAVFHADCGGHTSSAAAIWGNHHAYLIARRDEAVDGTHVRWTYTATAADVARALSTDNRTRVTGTLQSIEVSARDEAGRATRVAILGGTSRGGPHRIEARGEDFRQVMSRAFGARSLRSTWFEVKRDRDAFTFTGRGFGHGVGLCQAGALARLQSGQKPVDVLRFYYPGTKAE